MKVEMKIAGAKEQLRNVPDGAVVRREGSVVLVLDETDEDGDRLVAELDDGCIFRWAPSTEVTLLNVVAVEQ